MAGMSRIAAPSPQQIAYTLNDSGAEVVLVHADFVPLLAQLRDELTGVRKIVVMADGQAVPDTALALAGEHEALVDAAAAGPASRGCVHADYADAPRVGFAPGAPEGWPTHRVLRRVAVPWRRAAKRLLGADAARARTTRAGTA